ncbi:MAG: hypothetical protein JWN76_3348 [Chitinophagaceae bacterium]|nr:hypothetical protein [Chitinophagaceae bacterium]
MSSAKTSQRILSFIVAIFITIGCFSQSRNQSYYLLKVFHYKSDSQYHAIDEYLQNAYVPTLHSKGIKNVGAFKTYADTSDKRFYVLVPLKSIDQFERLESEIQNDQTFLNNSKTYREAAYNATAFTRMENILIKAFPQAPQPAVPSLTANKPERVYELRSYEGPSEQYFTNKVQMFNEGGEIALFKRLNFNAVFYGSVIAGSRMPNLMYMTTFNSKEDRDAHWKTFGADPEWKTLSAKPEYQHNVSKSDIIFLNPAVYSDF